MKEKKVVLGTGGLIERDEKIYFAATNVSALFEYDKKSRKIHLLPMEGMQEVKYCPYGYLGGCRFQDKIIFTPFFESELLIYDIKAPEKSKCIFIDSQLPKSKKTYRYYAHAVVYKNLVYCFGWDGCEMICIDMDTEKTSTVNVWQKAGEQEINSEKPQTIYTFDICVLDENLWAPLDCRGSVLKLNLKTQEFKVYNIKMIDMNFTTICFDGRNFWLTGNKAKIVKWNVDTQEIDIIDMFPSNFKNVLGETVFFKSAFAKGYVYFFPWCANMALKVNVKTGELEVFYEWEEPVLCDIAQRWEDDAFYIEWRYMSSAFIQSSMIIGLDGNVREKDIFTVGCDEIQWPYFINKTGIYEEGNILTLEKFIENEVEKKMAGKSKIYDDSYDWNGKAIYEGCK